MQDNPALADINEQYKRMDYDYDLISGNVHQVAYQKNQRDQFLHRYEYDADTWLKLVSTSIEKPDYEADTYTLKNVGGQAFQLKASYAYYLHGPLKQVVLADGLQKTDYTTCKAG
ncbi:MAG: hypothetical protein WA958_08005 [Tunicatimonas sp.]